MKKVLLKIWRILPDWMQNIAGAIIRPRHLVSVGAIILDEKGQLLLCQHTYRRQHPWGLPGGDLKHGEDPADGIRREFLEETGMTIKETRLILIENYRELHKVTLSYLCTGISGVFIHNDE